MKALSIQLPWGWLVCKNWKPVENRSLATSFRGRIYVHCGVRIDAKANQYVSARLTPEQWQEWLALYQGPDLWKYCGAIIGEVTIIDCVKRHASQWAEGPNMLVLQDGLLYPEPIRYRGKQGFFEVGDITMREGELGQYHC